MISKKKKPKHIKPKHHKYKPCDEVKVNKPTCGKCGGLVVRVPYFPNQLYTKKCEICGEMFF